MMSAIDSDTHGSSDESPLAPMMNDSDGPNHPRPTTLGASRLQSAERMMSAVDSGRRSRDTKTLGASRLQSAERMMSAVDSDTHGSAD
jgi:hypothetical protein